MCFIGRPPRPTPFKTDTIDSHPFLPPFLFLPFSTDPHLPPRLVRRLPPRPALAPQPTLAPRPDVRRGRRPARPAPPTLHVRCVGVRDHGPTNPAGARERVLARVDEKVAHRARPGDRVRGRRARGVGGTGLLPSRRVPAQGRQVRGGRAGGRVPDRRRRPVQDSRRRPLHRRRRRVHRRRHARRRGGRQRGARGEPAARAGRRPQERRRRQSARAAGGRARVARPPRRL